MEAQNQRTSLNRQDSKLFHLFHAQLQDIYWAEQELVKTLPKLKQASSSNELKQAFGNHLMETENHVSRLENIFRILGDKAKSTKCHAIVGIVKEGEDLIDETEKGTAERDAALIFAGQKVEHYEIASYGGLRQLAVTLGYEDVANILDQTLEEEKQADFLLSSIAKASVNENASRELISDPIF